MNVVFSKQCQITAVSKYPKYNWISKFNIQDNVNVRSRGWIKFRSNVHPCAVLTIVNKFSYD